MHTTLTWWALCVYSMNEPSIISTYLFRKPSGLESPALCSGEHFQNKKSFFPQTVYYVLKYEAGRR